MLDKFRKIIQGWLGKVLITLLLLPFALFGVSSIFQVNPNENIVAKVNGVEIDERELLRAIEVSKQNLISRLGEQASSFVTNEMIQPAALENLIEQELLRQSAKENKLNVSMQVIHKMISEMEAFQIDGRFSLDHYKEVLRRNGMRPELFPEKMRDQFLQNQMNSAYRSTVFATLAETTQLQDLYNQERTFSYVELPLYTDLDKIEISSDQIQSYYDSNKAEFRTEEQLVIEYIELNKSHFIEGIEISEEELEQKYEDKLKEVEETQERSASHILVEVNDQRGKDEAKELIQGLYSRLLAGENFEELSKKYSDDKGSASQGGDLGFAGRGVYVDAFEDTLFSLNIGELSKPVLTEFGYHIIKLNDLQPKVGKFDAMKPELAEELKLELADVPYQDALEELKNLAYESSDLAEPAAFINKPIKVSGKFSRNPDSLTGPFQGQLPIIEAAFSEEVLKNRNNSEVIELNDNIAVVLRLKEHFAASVKPVDEVSLQIAAQLKRQVSKEKAEGRSKEIVALLKAGRTKNEISQKFSLTWKEVESAKRDHNDIPAEMLEEIFKLPRNVDSSPYPSSFALSSGTRIVSLLTKVNAPSKMPDYSQTANVDHEEKAIATETLQYGRLLLNQKSDLEFQSFQSHLKSTAKIEMM